MSNPFHNHLDVCEQCRENPFALCATGAQLLREAATGGERPSPMKLDAEIVNRIFLDCLLRDDEMEGDKPREGVPVKLVEGITMNVGMHEERLKAHAEEIAALVAELPAEFQEGWSFLNMCNDRHGNLWTGMHQTMQELVLLAVGVGKMKLCAPRALWPMLPGGVPYYQVTL
jgi:hypothetical protein